MTTFVSQFSSIDPRFKDTLVDINDDMSVKTVLAVPASKKLRLVEEFPYIADYSLFAFMHEQDVLAAIWATDLKAAIMCLGSGANCSTEIRSAHRLNKLLKESPEALKIIRRTEYIETVEDIRKVVGKSDLSRLSTSK